MRRMLRDTATPLCGALTVVFLAGCAPESTGHDAQVRAASVLSDDGVPIAYDTRGTGAPALVFVHGWSCDRGYWSEQVEHFAQDHQVVAVDLAGHGESGAGRESWTIASFGTDVTAVVEDLGLESIVLIGHSMGGGVIVEAARRLPGRVAGLVWVDTYRQLHTSSTAELVQERLAPFRSNFVQTTRGFVQGMFPPGADEALVERVAADMSGAPPDVALGALESAWSYGREVVAALQDLNLPVVAINPDDDTTDFESLERNGVEVVLVPNVGHFLLMEDPAGFNTRLSEVIAGFRP